MKSLALQTLQSEYASLLQKLQRERVKSQTIEKKTNVADQEVNDLTNKNEDLIEQVKSLEIQLEESEKKREIERTDTAKEKEQWLRMLDMGGRLHSKNAEEKQKLKDEKTYLSQRLIAYNDENGSQPDQINHYFASGNDEPNSRPTDSSERMDQLSINVSGSAGLAANNVNGLKAENAALKKRIEVLRFSLEETRRRNQDLGERAQEIIQRNGDNADFIDRALQDEAGAVNSKTIEPKRTQEDGSPHSTVVLQKPNWTPHVLPTADQSPARVLSKSPSPNGLRNIAPSAASSFSAPTIADIARAHSPTPAELGIRIVPSTSSPEELIKALGPVPAPMSSLHFGPTPLVRSSDASKGSGSRSRKKTQKPSPVHAAGVIERREESSNMHVGSFRPLSPYIPSPYVGMSRTVGQTETSPHPYHSSPPPIADDSSSISSRSRSGSSPGMESSGYAGEAVSVPSHMTGHAIFATGLPQPLDTPRYIEAASAMPPPPRPRMHITDFPQASENRFVNLDQSRSSDAARSDRGILHV